MRDDFEQILVVDRALLEKLGMFHGLMTETARYLPQLLDPKHYRFVPRHAAEEDDTLKQLIPYFIIRCGDRIWHYTRGKQSGEGRLVAKVSIGIGGHINHQDNQPDGDLYTTGALRELTEEVILPATYSQKIVGLLNDDTNPVGRVHLGVVHILSVTEPDVKKREAVITEGGFRTLAELQQVRDRMETWSQICFDALPALLKQESIG
jgi:predicted NUDIX family phosphoesterase